MKRIFSIFIVVLTVILGIGSVKASNVEYNGVIYYRVIENGQSVVKTIDTLPSQLTANDLEHYEYLTYSYSSGTKVKFVTVDKLFLEQRVTAQDKQYGLYTIYNNTNASGPYIEWNSNILIYEYDVTTSKWSSSRYTSSYSNSINVNHKNNDFSDRFITTVEIIDQVPNDSYETDYPAMYNYPRVLLKPNIYMENGKATGVNVKFLTPYKLPTYSYGIQLNGGSWIDFSPGIFEVTPWYKSGFFIKYNSVIRFRALNEEGEVVDITEGTINFLEDMPVNIKGSIKFSYSDEFTTVNFWWDDVNSVNAYQYSFDNVNWIDINILDIDKEKGFDVITDYPKGTKVYSRVLGFNDNVLLTLESEIGAQEVTGENIQDNINDTTVDGATDIGGGFFDNFEDNDFGLSSIITAPLELIKSISTKSCVPLNLNIPYSNTPATIPCMTEIYEQNFHDVFIVYQTVTQGVVAYYIAINIYALVKGFKDPDNDKIEVVDL